MGQRLGAALDLQPVQGGQHLVAGGKQPGQQGAGLAALAVAPAGVDRFGNLMQAAVWRIDCLKGGEMRQDAGAFAIEPVAELAVAIVMQTTVRRCLVVLQRKGQLIELQQQARIDARRLDKAIALVLCQQASRCLASGSDTSASRPVWARARSGRGSPPPTRGR